MTSTIHTVEPFWSLERGTSAIVGTAIHDGHKLRPEVKALISLSDSQRLREEDPFTAIAIADVPNRIVVDRSRFEVDLNRAREEAVYIRPEQAWGLDVWGRTLPPDLVERSLLQHDAYYAMLRTVLSDLACRHGRFVLLDVHSYNHRRAGPDAEPTDPLKAPAINIGTFSMDREYWAPVVDPFMDALRAFEFRGQPMDVRENIAFEGRGEQTRFVHSTFPRTGCGIAIEFKKFFMDEWTGEPDREALAAMRALIASTLPVLEQALETMR